MKILFLTRNVPNPYSGGAIRPYHLIRNLSERFDHEICLVSQKGRERKSAMKEMKKHVTKIIEPPPLEKIKGIIPSSMKNLVRRDIKGKIGSKNGILYPSLCNHKNIQKRVDKIIQTEQIDTVYSDSTMAGYVGGGEMPKLIEPLDVEYSAFFSRFLSEEEISQKLRWFWKCLESFYKEMYVYRKFDFCVVVSEEDRKLAQRFLPNVKLIPNGVDIEYFQPTRLEENYPSLCYVGVLNTWKNVRSILYFVEKVFPIIREEMPEICLYIVGKDPHPKVRNLSNHRSIKVTGFVEDLRPYLSKASVFVYPGKWGTGIKNKILEAMAMAKPVVTTPTGAYGIESEEGKNMLIRKDPIGFAEAVIELLQNENKRSKIGERARRTVVKHHSWKKCSDEVNRLFEFMKHHS